MRSIAEHTYEGITRPVGTVYEVDAQYEETITLLKFAVRVGDESAPAETLTKAPPPLPPEPPATKPKAKR